MSIIPTNSTSPEKAHEVGSAIETSPHDEFSEPRHHGQTSGGIRNPLAGLSKSQLLQEAEDFAEQHGLSDQVAHFRRAALAAQKPDDSNSIPELLESDRAALVTEKHHRWKHPKALYFTILMNSISAAVQGWDQTGSNGANLSYPEAFGIADFGDACEASGTCSRNSWIIGAINSAPYMAICLVSWLTDPLNEYCGRRDIIFIGAVFSLAAPIGQAVSQSWVQILICRILLGIGMGLKEVAVPVFSAENAPANIRGALIMSWQLFVAFGIMLGFTANLVVVDAGDIAWRLQLGSAFIPAVPLLIGIYFTPESPRWLMKRNRHAQAFNSLLKLRGDHFMAARDMFVIHTQLTEEARTLKSAGFEGSNFFTRVTELLTIPRNRRATYAAGIVMAAQQFCGINIIAFYSSTIFAEAGASNKEALLASWGFGMAMFVFAFPALYTIDTWGRRTLLLSTFPNMAWTLLGAGMAFYIPKESPAHLGLVAMFIYLFVMFYGPGEGPCPFVYSAECFPLSHREVGMSWGVSTNNFWAVIVALTFPRMLRGLGPQGSFGLYAGMNIVCFIAIFLWLPETKQRTLEELDDVFSVETVRHMSFQVTEVLPWWYRRYILRKKGEAEPQLYHFPDKQDEAGGTL